MMTKVRQIAYYSFYLAVVMEVLMVIVDKSAYTNPIEGRLFQITFLLFTVKTALTKYSFREYLVIFLFLLLGAVSYFVTGKNEIVRVVMFIAACKNIDMKKCLKLVFYMTLAGCVALMLLSLTGIYGAVSLTQDYGRGSVETRYTLGLGHPNALQCMVWALTTLGLYLYGEKMKWYYYLLVLVVNIGFFFLTDSKTSLLVTIFAIFLAYVLLRKKPEWILKAGAMAGIVVTVFSVAISVMIAANAYRLNQYIFEGNRSFATTFLMRLNEMINGRIRILVANTGNRGTIQTWSLFAAPENDYYFDLGWVRLFYWYGIIPACIFVAVLLIMLFYCYKEKQYMAIMLVASFALYTVIEAHAVSVYLARNYVFFIMGSCWYQIFFREEKVNENQT